MEEMNKPTVMVINKGFLNDALSTASNKGMPGIRIVTEDIISECSVKEQIEAGISPIMDDIITALSNPLTTEEKSPKPRKPEKPSRIIFKGNLEEVNRFFYRRGWGDGLPVIPPTEEAVAEMMTGTDLPLDYLLGRLAPRQGKVTVEKVAVHAVMAGALPTYMPLLIAGVKLLVGVGGGAMAVSTSSQAMYWIINGPIRSDLHINCSYGAMSPGDIANATIGRVMGLMLKNLGGIRKGIEDMGVLGNPMKYSMILAENEEESPWEPLHVQRGFDKKDNTISSSASNHLWMVQPYGTDDKGILRSVIYNLLPGVAGPGGGGCCILLSPIVAGILASSGWTKRDIADFVSEHARIPLNRIPQYYGNFPEFPYKALFLNPEDYVPIISRPEAIQILVMGGIGSWVGIIGGGGRSNIAKVELPVNWDQLVKKYKDIMPTYIKY